MGKTGWGDKHFMTLVYLIADLSKDKSTHLGAVIVGPDNEIRSTGYNSFPRGLNDFLDERQQRPEKYYWIEHAERNAIYNATLIGVSLKNCRMYTNDTPCADCARAIIQSGVKEIIIDKKWGEDNGQNWKEWEGSLERSAIMFKESGIQVRYYDGDFVNPCRFKRGERNPL